MFVCKPKSNRGLTLLEVIISVGILAGGIVVILQAFIFCARVTGLSCDTIQAIFLSEDKFQELEFQEKQKLIKEEVVEDKKDKFNWEYSLSLDSNLSLPDCKIYKLDFNLTFSRPQGKEQLNLNTYFRQ